MLGSLAEVLNLFGLAWHTKADAIHRRMAYVTNAGAPGGSVTPDFIGQELLDTTNNVWYRAKGLANTDWQRTSIATESPHDFTFSVAQGAANICNVTITPKDSSGVALAGIMELEIWLSDAATGAGLTATTASGTVQAKSGEGTVLTALTAKKHILALTKSAGTFILEITDTAKTGFYVAVRKFGGVAVSAQLVTGNYG